MSPKLTEVIKVVGIPTKFQVLLSSLLNYIVLEGDR